MIKVIGTSSSSGHALFLIGRWKIRGINKNGFNLWRSPHFTSDQLLLELFHQTKVIQRLLGFAIFGTKFGKKRGKLIYNITVKTDIRVFMHVSLLHETQILQWGSIFTWMLCPLTFTVREILCRNEFAAVCTCLLKRKSAPRPLRKARAVTSGFPVA